MSKELVKKFILCLKQNKSQEAKRFLTEAINSKLEEAKKNAIELVEGRKARVRAKVRTRKQTGKLGKPCINKPKLLKFNKKLKENIDSNRVKFTVKAEAGKVPVDIHLQHFTDYLQENGIDVRFNEDTKDYCVPSEQWNETVTLLKQRQYEPIKKEASNIETPKMDMEDLNNNIDDISDDNMEDEVDMEDDISDDRKDKLRQNISDIRSKLELQK